MKKIFFWLAWLWWLPAVSGAELHVATTLTNLEDLVRLVGGDHVEAFHLVEGYQDPHHLQAKPSLMRKLRSADALVYTGLELESGWLPLVLQGSRNPKIQPGAPGLIDASQDIAVLEKPQGPLDRSQGDIHPFGNPHYYLDPVRLGVAAKTIARGLTRIDPIHAEFYEQNAKLIEQRLEKLARELEAQLAPLKGKTVVTYHRNLSYFLERFGLQAVGFVENKPGIPPSTRHLEELSNRMRAQNTRLILYQPYHDASLCRKLARKAGGETVLFPTEIEGVKESKDTFSHFRLLARILLQAFSRIQGEKP